MPVSTLKAHILNIAYDCCFQNDSVGGSTVNIVTVVCFGYLLL